MLNLLFESGEILKQKAKEIEDKNILTLQETNREIKELLEKVKKSQKKRVIHVHENMHYNRVSAFPVDHRILNLGK